MSTPDFTIITPNRDGGTYLRECLASVASQTGVTYEHWLIDGESGDNSLAIAREFPSLQVVSEPDGGMAEAINKGFDRAAGRWVMWLNSDDRLKPGALAGLKQICDGAGQDADVVYGTFDFVDAEGRSIRRMRLIGWSRFITVFHCCYVPSTATVFRRESVIDAGFRLDTGFHYLMDAEFQLRLDQAGKKFWYHPMALADFRLHGNNLSHRYSGKDRDRHRVLAAEHQHAESRALRRIYGNTLSSDPYLQGIMDGFLYLTARAWKGARKLLARSPVPPPR